MTKVLLPWLFLSMGFGELQRLPGMLIYGHDLILAALLLINCRRLKFYRPVGWFIAAGLISLIAAAGRLPLAAALNGLLYLVRFWFYSLLAGIKVPPRYLIGFSSLVAGLGWLQYLLIPDTRFLLGMNFDEHYYRLLSTLFDPNFTAVILVLGLVQIFYYRPRAMWLYGLHLPALVLTYSRSGYLAFFAAIFAIAILHKKFKLILFILIFLFSLLFLPRPGGEGVKLERLASVYQRLDNYRLGLLLWQQSPVFGLGFNTLRYYRDNPVSHSASGLDSSLLLVLATTGVTGLAAYLYWLKSLWDQGPAVKTTLVVLLVNSLFVNSLFFGPAMIWLWSVVDA